MGLENLLQALATLTGPDAPKLAIVGEGIINSPLRGLCAELGLEGRVRLVGRVSDKSLRDWYRAADLFVLPTVAYEGFGMVTAEALASGTPVVGTPVGATPELLEPLDPSLVSESIAPAAVAASIRGALSAGPELRQRSREYACERFGWSRAIQSWEAALLSTAALRTGRQASPVELAPSAPKRGEA
jgi:glycosyltransferase involved in cell wall biosynthesis